MTATAIEWTDVTWNPVRGCARVSPGCEHCYAEKQAARFCSPTQPYAGLVSVRSHVSGLRYTDPRAAGSWTEPRWTGVARFFPSKLSEPLGWKDPQRVFVNSMSDLFHEDISDEQIAAVFGVMAICRRHTFQILTKRPERMAKWFRWMRDEGFDAGKCGLEASNLGVDIKWRDAGYTWPLPNVWLGVSCEDQLRADARIPLLLETPAAARFVSAEPLLSPVDFLRIPWPERHPVDVLRGGTWNDGSLGFVNHSDMNTLDWVIVGGESGYGARACDVAWVRSIVTQCADAGVSCFVKQLGARPVEYDRAHEWFDGDNFRTGGLRLLPIKHRKGGDMNEWPDDLRVRRFPFEESAR